jgi:hypothetical protein
MANIDLFGNAIVEDVLLRDKFIEPPFSVLDTKSGNWQRRKKLWIAKGLNSEVGRDAKAFNLAALDPETLFVTYLYSATIEKLTSKKMVLIGFQRHPNGYLSTKETWNLVRATH